MTIENFGRTLLFVLFLLFLLQGTRLAGKVISPYVKRLSPELGEMLSA